MVFFIFDDLNCGLLHVFGVLTASLLQVFRCQSLNLLHDSVFKSFVILNSYVGMVMFRDN